MTGAPFLATTLTGYRVALEVAWGADLTDLAGAGWTWTDITADVVFGGAARTHDSGISIAIGRPDESQETQTALMTCTLDNRSGNYSAGGMSANWPNVRRGTPVRVRVSTNGGTSWNLRFQGSANGFSPAWDEGTSRWATVELSASGPLRRLDQGTPLTTSSIYQAAMVNPNLTSYWPCEDPPGATRCAAVVNGSAGYGSIYSFTTGITFGIPGKMGAYAGIPTSAPIMTVGERSGLYCEVGSVVATAQSTVRFVVSGHGSVEPMDELMNGSVDQYTGLWPTGALLMVSTPNGGSVKSWVIRTTGTTPSSNGAMVLLMRGYGTTAPGSGDATVFDSGNIVFNGIYGDDAELGLSLSQSGSTTTYRMWVRNLGSTSWQVWSASQSNSGSTAPSVSRVLIGPYRDVTGMAVGHVQVLNTAITGTTQALRDPYDGRPGEAPGARVVRLASENDTYAATLDVALAGSVSVADAMGTQHFDTLSNLMRECERTNQGFLFDGWGAGLTFITREYRESAATSAATLTLDAASAQLMGPFTPTDDDQVTVNHVSVTRQGGNSADYADATGTLGVNAIGDYSTSFDVNPQNSDNLGGYAAWRVAQGTAEGYRYPTVSFALETNASLIPGWLACTPQSRIDVTNVASVLRQHATETIRLLIEGWHETIDAFTWRVTANTSRAEKWNVVRLAAATGSTGDGICHLDTDGSQLNASVSAGATSIAVKTNSGPLWVTTTGDADSFPFDIDIGGIRATVTAISGATSPQTFTLSAGLPRAFTGSATVGAGVPIKVWRPPVFGL